MKNKGITLIALVVTIVVLLILAGITISLIFSENGIISKAREAKEATVISSIKERIELDKLSKRLEKEGDITEEELKDILNNYGEIIYEENETTIKGIIEKDNGYEVLLPDIMDGVLNQNIYVTLYTDGTLGFSNNQETIEGKTVSKSYGNIKGKVFEQRVENNIVYTIVPWDKEQDSITNAIFVNEIKPSSTDSWFFNCKQLVEIQKIQNLDTKQVTTMYGMFWGCWSLKEVDVSGFDTSKVTNMNRMFADCQSITSLNLKNFDTRLVTDMECMFWRCKELREIDLSSFDTNKVINMGRMMEQCLTLEFVNISSLDTSKVTDMNRMFAYDSNLKELDISNFDTSKVENMDYMFYTCSKLTKLDVSKFNTSQVTTMEGMFGVCTELTMLDLNNFDTSNVINMMAMFNACVKLESLDISSFNISKVIDMSHMFRGSNQLKVIYVGSGWKINEETKTELMFHGCGTSSVTVK